MTETWRSTKNARRDIASAKEKKEKDYASDLNDSENQHGIFRMAKQMAKERQVITGSNRLKGVSAKVIVDEKGVKDSWKEYIEKLMNEWDRWILARAKRDQQIASRLLKLLLKTKKHKAPGLSGLAAEMIWY